jgi:thymidylate synthase ThyX
MTDRQLAKILADSLSPDGVRLTTMEVVMPRIVLAEFNTHRQFSRNSASSRAIPIEKMLRRVIDDPYIPEQWDRNGAGMQGHGLLDESTAYACKMGWLRARDAAVHSAEALLDLGLHKQTTNRLLEPFMWHAVIVTATEWSNFFHLRCHPAAHPAIRRTAEAMRELYESHEPKRVAYDEWHLPLVDERDDLLSESDAVKVSVARCARVSYLTHDGVRDPAKDIELHDSLLANGHMSPFEHAAKPMDRVDVIAALCDFDGLAYEMCDDRELNVSQHFSGNFRGWVQYRKTIAGEADILANRSNTAC